MIQAHPRTQQPQPLNKILMIGSPSRAMLSTFVTATDALPHELPHQLATVVERILVSMHEHMHSLC
jgi:hypothetical protein